MNALRRISASLRHRARYQIAKPAEKWIDLNLGDKIASHKLSRTPNPEANPRIAVVKQDVYPDLYCCHTGATPNETIFSSLKRTGPVAFFTRLNADFFIIRATDDPECTIWRQKAGKEGQKPASFYEDLRTSLYPDASRGQKLPHSAFSIEAGAINWSDYDIIVSLDIAIPSRITELHRNSLWCYYVSEPMMPAYDSSRETPIIGYNIFFNQKFPSARAAPAAKEHVIDFPYCFISSDCLQKVATPPGDSNREGVFLESHTAAILTDEQKQTISQIAGPIRQAEGTTENVIRSLMASRYFVRFGGRALWGNAMAEAISAGALAIGDPTEFYHSCLFTSRTSVSKFDQLTRRLEQFEQDPLAFEREKRKQATILDYTNYSRPLRELHRKLRFHRN